LAGVLGGFAAAAATASGEPKQFPMANQPRKQARVGCFFLLFLFLAARARTGACDPEVVVRVDDALVVG